jgi:hypothetical protein
MRISLETALVGVISLIGAVIVYSAMTPAKAQSTTCQTYGNQTTCFGPIGTRATTCTRYGNITTCF